jgi:ribosome-associated translation inhibitor RaiA
MTEQDKQTKHIDQLTVRITADTSQAVAAINEVAASIDRLAEKLKALREAGIRISIKSDGE